MQLISLFGDLSNDPARISRSKYAAWHISRHFASGTDHRLIADLHARTDDRTTADPHVGANIDLLTEFLLSTQICIDRMYRSVNLNRRTEQREVTDGSNDRQTFLLVLVRVLAEDDLLQHKNK